MTVPPGPTDVAGPRPLAWLLAPIVLPHEFAHYLVFAPWGESLTVEVGDGGFDAPDVVLGRLGGTFSTSMPVWAVRVGALAPTLCYPAAAVLLDLALGVAGGPLATGAFVLFSLWAAPSGGDVAVFRHAREVREAGTLDAGVPAERSRLPETALTVLAMLVLALVFLA